MSVIQLYTVTPLKFHPLHPFQQYWQISKLQPCPSQQFLPKANPVHLINTVHLRNPTDTDNPKNLCNPIHPRNPTYSDNSKFQSILSNLVRPNPVYHGKSCLFQHFLSIQAIRQSSTSWHPIHPKSLPIMATPVHPCLFPSNFRTSQQFLSIPAILLILTIPFRQSCLIWQSSRS